MFNKRNEMATLVKEMVELLNEYNLSEIEYEKGDSRIRISNKQTGALISSGLISTNQPSSTTDTSKNISQNSEDASKSIDLNKAFKSPMVGVVYLKPEPGAKDFIVEGQTVKKGDTLCLIEAMKTFNPVKATSDGTIKKILINEGETIEYEQPLFIIE